MSVTSAPAESQRTSRHQWISQSEEPEPEGSVSDRLISAYQDGKEKGWVEVFETMDKVKNLNFQHAREIVERLFVDFEDVYQLNPSATLLAVETPSHFKAATLIPEKKAISDKALEAIRQTRRLLEEEREDLFYMDHIFIPESEHLDSSLLKADGYHLRYEPEST